MKAGIGYLPEDRQKQGLILDWGLGQNVTLSTLEKFTKFTVINRKAERERSKELWKKLKQRLFLYLIRRQVCQVVINKRLS